MCSTCTISIPQSSSLRSSVHSASDSLIFRDYIYSYKGQTSSTAIFPLNFLWSYVIPANHEVSCLFFFSPEAYWTWQLPLAQWRPSPERLLSLLETLGAHKFTCKHMQAHVHTNTDARIHRCTHSILALHCCFQQGPLDAFSPTCCDDDVNGKRKALHLWN